MERGIRRLYPRGPGKDHFSYEENKRRQNISDRTALKRAGYKRHPKSLSQIKFKKGHHTFSEYHYTRVMIYSDLSDYVVRILRVKTPISGGVTPTWKRSLHAKQIKRKVGGDRTERKVYSLRVKIKEDVDTSSASLMDIGRSFNRESFIGCPETSKLYGIRPGHLLVGTPTSESRIKLFFKSCVGNYGVRVRYCKITDNGCWFIAIVSKIERVK